MLLEGLLPDFVTRFVFILAALLALLDGSLPAAPLDGARVSRVVNEVSIAPTGGGMRRLSGPDSIHAGERLTVGARSRAELLFADGTLARLGAGTVLALPRGRRELTLERGTLLLEVPARRGGARIHCGGLSGEGDRATIILEHLEGRSVKVAVLAGDVRIFTGGRFGDSIILRPGKLLITAPDVQQIPDPADVDLAALVKTSALLSAAPFATSPLASLPRIEREIALQAAAVARRRLIPTNLTIVGSGTQIVVPAAAWREVVAAPAPPLTNERSRIKGEKLAIKQGSVASGIDGNFRAAP